MMLKKVLAFSTAVLFVTGAAFAGAPQDKGKKTAKTIDVMTCPITGEAVKGEGGGTTVAGKYTAHFCCAGCKPKFDAMTKKDQEKKLAELVKKQKAGKKS